MALRHLPTQLASRLPAMTVRTPDNAFRHLLFDLSSTAASADKNTDLRNLLAAHMVELKYNDIAFTAVDARVNLKKSPNEFAIVLPLVLPTLVTAPIMFIAILLVVHFAVCAVTFSAIRYGKELSDLS
jgi:hypothetical protein